ncbi:hypothetical protein [Desulfovibrio litoralis]|uniref:Uncharacterized protein n=1 Tax=Desulfovibrio litoralis DSM 11393 TaxID=1121455 RepID=A0A1M7SSX8_9BACT|nr:hypothetical protein [Desulfovibrio litoralis]SHN61589.1 hypothetical protein SAMN02745728_01239 [Desulfovibrio litoralis DSM 11393]
MKEGLLKLLGVALLVAMPFALGLNKVASANTNNAGIETVTAPQVTLKMWQDSTQNERYAFLLGFVSMLELEKEWQGKKPVPFRQSLIGTWSKALDGVTVKQMYETVENHIKTNPGDINVTVLQVLWYDMVQPKVNDILAAEKTKPRTRHFPPKTSPKTPIHK